MRFLKITFLAACCLLLSACSSFQFNLTDLMQAPKLSEDQAEIYEALTDAVGVSDVQLKYPKSGAYRSAFVMFDLDADGEKEALVFYNMPSWGGNVRIMILDHQQEKWVSVYDAVGEGTDITEVDFRILTSSGRYCLMIGWEQGTSENTNISVYDYTGGQLRVLFESEYSQMLIEDIDQDGVQEILLGVFKASAKMGSIRLINDTDEGLQPVSRVVMDNTITKFLRIDIGFLSEDQTAVFVDAYTSSTQIVTEIMVYTEEGRLVPLSGHAGDLDRLLVRELPVRCEDIDGDGILEIPVSLNEYNEEEREDDNRKNMIQYVRLSNPEALEMLKVETASEQESQESVLFSFAPVWTGFLNPDYGFRFQFPDEWVNQVDVLKETNRSEWVFTLKSDAAEPTALLRIRVYGQDEPRDVFDNVSYERLEKRGVYEYYAAVQLSGVPERMQIGMEEVKKRFSTVKS
ncbi:MAG TPA: hypothetical protein DEP43_05780 [Ruminococcaceae bacterium]|nr:hypothetical protein [Oscillospiraceae bacterium]HCB65457.1 hypothetical protein [Oscillospiraceae bacterium]